jgi:GAF domain-containing protein
VRYHGREQEAARAERAAVRVDLALQDPKATARMFASGRAVREAAADGRLLESALDGAIALLGADYGNIQLCEPKSGALRIVTHAGLNSEFLERFATVDDDSSACGRAAGQRAQIVIADVNEDAAFAPHRQIASSSRFRAVQSTPLVDAADRLIGVVSTHFRRPHRPSARDLLLIEWYVERIAGAIGR